MRRTSVFYILKPVKLLLPALIIIIAGCSLEKESGFNRSMQNLTAHYNILFNAKEILRLKQESYATSFVDDYNEVLSVYQDTTAKSKTPDKDLELAIVKANTIITIKEQSKYLGDAYLVLGKANYLEGNYFNAVEYFSYVIRSFPKRKDLLQDALVWKTRTLMYLDQLPQAKPVIDTAILTIDPKKKAPADIYATKLQYDINAGDYTDGEEMAKKAVQYCGTKTQRLRWTFILAQLQELNNKTADAIKNYSQIAESNALFEMAFNASLNLIRIEDMQNGVKINRIDRLLSLLKNPNDKEFKDQIYYQVAQLELIDKNVNDAIKYYNLSIRSSTKNQNQKGLSYLRLAEIYFKNKNDYLISKKYYDSTLTTLSINYPGYQAIQKKGNNLQLLADRLQIITREDTLQALARMDEKTRLATIDKMVNDRTLQQLAVANNAAAGATGITNTATQVGSSSIGGSFYFDNASAVGQGFADFKKTWGNRKLEDNWRRSSRSNNNIVGTGANSIQGSDPDAPIYQSQVNKGSTPAGNYRRELIQGLPLNPALLAQSNQRVYNAYTDIGNFYRDVLEDKSEAIGTFELMLTRFPNDPNRPAIYYNLYRLYSDLDKSKSDLYKNKLLKEYPTTPFAQIITDPEFAKKLDDKNAGFTQAYNVVFDLYTHKQYKEVIDCVPELIKQYPGNKLSAQLYYLQALSAGHFETVIPFRDSLQSILNRYPNDRLISPLITQHLTFINDNKEEMLTRKVVLADDDPHDIPFTLAPDLQQTAAYQHAQRPAVITAQVVKAPEKKQDVAVKQPDKPAAEVQHDKPAVAVVPDKPILATQPDKPVIQTETSIAPPVVKPPDAAPSIFSMRDSTNYYFVVNVNSGTTNLSSSRFGIGQFDRANYQGKGIKHQLIAIEGDNQLIYVGRFMTLDGVKNYARQIVPLLPDIMKVPRDKYSFFIITQENLNKLADKKTLDSYIDYYQKNY